eukprot:GHVQ01012015.1.p1 GENE.GHVQ01012015.1~~GHVQ01012015.1.p1  ORF type:complete len:831 (-),score=96.39 GHVQ01012015.1:314-2806(-)
MIASAVLCLCLFSASSLLSTVHRFKHTHTGTHPQTRVPLLYLYLIIFFYITICFQNLSLVNEYVMAQTCETREINRNEMQLYLHVLVLLGNKLMPGQQTLGNVYERQSSHITVRGDYESKLIEPETKHPSLIEPETKHPSLIEPETKHAKLNRRDLKGIVLEHVYLGYNSLLMNLGFFATISVAQFLVTQVKILNQINANDRQMILSKASVWKLKFDEKWMRNYIQEGEYASLTNRDRMPYELFHVLSFPFTKDPLVDGSKNLWDLWDEQTTLEEDRGGDSLWAIYRNDLNTNEVAEEVVVEPSHSPEPSAVVEPSHSPEPSEGIPAYYDNDGQHAPKETPDMCQVIEVVDQQHPVAGKVVVESSHSQQPSANPAHGTGVVSEVSQPQSLIVFTEDEVAEEVVVESSQSPEPSDQKRTKRKKPVSVGHCSRDENPMKNHRKQRRTGQAIPASLSVASAPSPGNSNNVANTRTVGTDVRREAALKLTGASDQNQTKRKRPKDGRKDPLTVPMKQRRNKLGEYSRDSCSVASHNTPRSNRTGICDEANSRLVAQGKSKLAASTKMSSVGEGYNTTGRDPTISSLITNMGGVESAQPPKPSDDTENVMLTSNILSVPDHIKAEWQESLLNRFDTGADDTENVMLTSNILSVPDHIKAEWQESLLNRFDTGAAPRSDRTGICDEAKSRLVAQGNGVVPTRNILPARKHLKPVQTGHVRQCKPTQPVCAPRLVPTTPPVQARDGKNISIVYNPASTLVTLTNCATPQSLVWLPPPSANPREAARVSDTQHRVETWSVVTVLPPQPPQPPQPAQPPLGICGSARYSLAAPLAPPTE